MKLEIGPNGLPIVPEDALLTVDHEQVRGRDYSGRKLFSFCAIGSRFEACRFDKVDIDDGSFGAGREMSEYIDCSFDGAQIRGCGTYVRFVRCSFRNVILRDWLCFSVEMIDCIFSGRMRGAFFNGTVPERNRQNVHRERNEFHGNDFSAMDLIDVDFRTGIDLTQQRLPTGPDYLYLPNAAVTVERAKSDIARWQDSKLKEQALSFVDIQDEQVNKGGQRQLLLRASTYGSASREMIDAVFAVLRKNANAGA